MKKIKTKNIFLGLGAAIGIFAAYDYMKQKEEEEALQDYSENEVTEDFLMVDVTDRGGTNQGPFLVDVTDRGGANKIRS